MNTELANNAKALAKEMRIVELDMLGDLGFGHIGGAFSATDAIAVLYAGEMKYDPKNPNWEGRDRIVLSKGHAGPALYAVLAIKGFFPKDMIYTLNRGGTHLPSHADRNLTPGIDMTTGSLGQGISTAAGIACALRAKGSDNNVYCIIGDGESQEGQVWEAAMFIAHQKLENFVLFVDSNKKQIDGKVEDENSLGDIEARYAALNWNVQRCDGNDTAQLTEAVEKAKTTKNGRPNVIIMDTIKGCGVSFIEAMEVNHHIPVSREDADRGIKELRGE